MKQAGVFSSDASPKAHACTPCVRQAGAAWRSLIHVSPLTPEFDLQSEDDDWRRVPVNPQNAKPGRGTPTADPG